MDISSINNSVSLIVWSFVSVTVLIVLVVVWRVILPLVRNSSQNKQLLQNGIPAQAMILRTWDTGVAVNNNPSVGFLLEVRPANMPPFQASAQMLVSYINISQYQPGMPVEVKYNPTNPNKVVITGTPMPQTYGFSDVKSSNNRY